MGALLALAFHDDRKPLTPSSLPQRAVAALSVGANQESETSEASVADFGC